MRDSQHFLATTQDWTTEAVSTDEMDLGAANKNLGNSQLYAHLLVTTAATTLTEGATITIVDSAAAALTSDRALAMFTSTTCSDDGVIPPGDLTAGTHLICALPPGIKYKRYLGVHFTPASTAAGTFIFDCWISNVAGEIDLQ